MSIKRLTQLSLLTAMALIIFIIELLIPNLIPIPGVKLGLANIVTVFAVYRFKAGETAMLVLTRILLGSIFSGNMSSLIYSATGAAFCLCGMLLLQRIVPKNYIWLSSILGAMLHNTGQILIAIIIIIIIMKTTSVLVYYPILLITGSIAGFFTGMCAQYILRHKETNKSSIA